MLLGGLLTLDLINNVFEKVPRSLNDYFGIRQRNWDLQAGGIPECQREPRRRFQRGSLGRIERVAFWFIYHVGRERRQKKSSTWFEIEDERFAVKTPEKGPHRWIRQRRIYFSKTLLSFFQGGKRKQFIESHLLSQRNSLGKTLTDGSYGWKFTNLWQKRTAGQISEL